MLGLGLSVFFHYLFLISYFEGCASLVMLHEMK